MRTIVGIVDGVVVRSDVGLEGTDDGSDVGPVGTDDGFDGELVGTDDGSNEGIAVGRSVG